MPDIRQLHKLDAHMVSSEGRTCCRKGSFYVVKLSAVFSTEMMTFSTDVDRLWSDNVILCLKLVSHSRASMCVDIFTEHVTEIITITPLHCVLYDHALFRKNGGLLFTGNR